MFDLGIGRTRRQIVFEIFDRFRVAFNVGFDAPVFEIFHVAQNLMTRGGALGEKPETDSLHESADDEFSRRFHKITNYELRITGTV